jgi:16S rRNA U1498 N3-methylase RsmE
MDWFRNRDDRNGYISAIIDNLSKKKVKIKITEKDLMIKKLMNKIIYL